MINYTLLISKEDFFTLCPVSKNIDWELLRSNALVSQETHIAEVLGSAQYNALVDAYNNHTDTGLTATLMNYVAKCLVWYTLYNASPWVHGSVERAGINITTPQDNTAASDENVTLKIENALATAIRYRNDMINYLELNKDSYPLYRAATDNSTIKTYGSGIRSDFRRRNLYAG
jgi:hypothetical protein